jgi:lipopolysaccharide/colanic/teichoic acid biosynthesis glycosyltransferase
MTGLWQITSRLDEDFDQRATLDLAYIERWSLRLDLTILLRTIPAVLRRPRL